MTEPEPPSPLLRWITPLALATWVAAVLARTQSSGAGQELHTPGAQVFFDALTLSALALALVEALLARRALRLWAHLGLGGALIVGLWAAGAHAPDPELGWRTALSWTAAAGLAAATALLASAGGRARWLGAVLVGSVLLGACSGLHEVLVEAPALQRDLEQGRLQELALYEADFQQGLRERIYGAAATGPWLLPNMLACAIAMVFPLTLAHAAAQRGARRVLAGGACVVLVAALVATESKGGVLAFLASLGAFAVLHPRWRRLRTKLLLGVAGAGALLGGVGTLLFLRAREAEGVGLSLTVRLEYWSAAWRMGLDAPWLGHGLNAFRALYPRYKLPVAEEALHAHNAPLELWVELGALGLLGLVALVGLVAWRAVRGAPRAELAPDPSQRAGLGVGLAFGGLVLLAGSDVLGLNLEWLLVLLGVGGVAWGLAEGAPLPADRWRAALAAGCVGFAADGATNFGLHQAGCLTAVCVLVGLLRAGAPVESEPAPHPSLLAATGGACVLALVGVLWAQPLMLADAAREEARALHMEGAELARTGKRARATEALEGARAGFQAAIDAYPAYADSYRERAAVSRGLGDLEQAVADLERAAEREPTSAAIRDELGLALQELGDLPRARAAFDAALERYPLHPAFLLDAAEAWAQHPEPDPLRARDFARRALEASDAPRLVLRKLTDAQRARAEALAAE
ncbi:MAG: O-antigen ligase family protein [Planctomycetota bacterium]